MYTEPEPCMSVRQCTKKFIQKSKHFLQQEEDLFDSIATISIDVHVYLSRPVILDVCVCVNHCSQNRVLTHRTSHINNNLKLWHDYYAELFLICKQFY